MSNGIAEPLPLFGYDPSVVPDIDFCVKDASVIESEVITNYENLFYLATKIAKTLGRGDPVRLFLLTIIYQIVVQRSIIDSTGKENLLKYAHGANLDNLGAKWGLRGQRLPATSATTTLRFTFSSLLTSDSTIPLGTLAKANDGRTFATTQEGTIVAGGTAIDLPAVATIPGANSNGLVAGQINQLVSWNSPFLVSVANIVMSSGGTDIETDEHLRARIWMAPESFSCAGPYGAYEYWAASANADIIDVSVWSDPPHAGKVYIYPLMKDGELPSAEVIDQVYAVCNEDRIRPLTDQVFVQPPIPVTSTGCVVKYWIRTKDEQFENEIKEKCEQAFADFLYWQKTKIGRDINPSKCDQMIIEAGAKRTDISEETSTFEFMIVNSQSVADLVSPTLTYMGLEDE
jgi:phage-related baseplate assembly protein